MVLTMYSSRALNALKRFENESPLHIYLDIETGIPYFKKSYAEQRSSVIVDVATRSRLWFDPRPLMKFDLSVLARGLSNRFPQDFVRKVLMFVGTRFTMVNVDGDALADHVYEYFVLEEPFALVYFYLPELKLDVVPRKLLVALGIVEDVVGIVDEDLRIVRDSENGIYAVIERGKLVGCALRTEQGIEVFERWEGVDPYTYVLRFASRGTPSLAEVYRANKEYIDTLVEKVRRAVDWFEHGLGRKGWLAISGGKDSVLAAYLLHEAESNFDAVYTHIERGDPEHVRSYVEKLSTKLGFKLYVIEHRWSKISKLLEAFGAPFRGYRWCTYVFKFYPQLDLAKKIHGLEKIVSYTGSRRYETFKRSIKPATYVDVELGVVNHSVPYKFPKLLVYLVLRYRYGEQLLKDYLLGFERLSCISCPYKSCFELKLSEQLYGSDFDAWKPYLEKICLSMGMDVATCLRYHAWRFGYQIEELREFSTSIASASLPRFVSVVEIVDGFEERLETNCRALLSTEPLRIGDEILVRYRSTTVRIRIEGRRARIAVEGERGWFRAIAVTIASLGCVSCGLCIAKCRNNAIELPFRVDASRCTKCMLCIDSCPLAIRSFLGYLCETRSPYHAYRWLQRTRKIRSEEYIERAKQLEEELYRTKTTIGTANEAYRNQT